MTRTTTSLRLARIFENEMQAEAEARKAWENFRDANGNRAANGRMYEVEYCGSQHGYVVRVTRANAFKPSNSLFVRD